MKSKLAVRRRGSLRQRGNVLVEFALMSTVLLMMTMGVVDFGRVFALANKTMNAAAAGTQYGALSPSHYTDMVGMQNAALADLGSITGATAVATQTCRCSIGGTPVTCPATCGSSGLPETHIEVSVTVPFQTISALPWLPGLDTVKGRSIVRVQ